MTPEEQAERQRLIDEIERKRLIREIQRKQQAAPAEEEFDANWKDRAEMLTQGATLNLGDEVYSGLSALGGEIKDMFSDDGGQTLLSRAKAKHDELAERRRQYREARPAEALGLELAGGLATGGVGAGRVALAKSLSGAKRLMAGTGLGIGEGAIAGFGSSPGGLEDRLRSAGTGGAIGGATGGLLTAGGSLARTLSKRRVDKDLIDDKGRFTPITMADEKGIPGQLYRQGVRRIWGAGQKLDEQGQWIMDSAQRRLDRATGLQKGRAGQVEPARMAADDAATAARRNFEDTAGSQLDRQAAKIQDEFEQVSQRAAKADETVKETLSRRAANAAETDRAAFRANAARRAVPDRAGDDLLDEVADLEPEAAFRKMKGWWKKNGFEQAKANPVKWDNTFREDLKFLVGSEPTLGRSVYEDIVTLPGMRKRIENARAALASARNIKDPKKVPVHEAAMEMLDNPHLMRGDVFMAIRNNFARSANKVADPWSARKMRNMVDAFDTKIVDSLPEAQKADFLADKARYRDFLHYGDAVKQAFKKRGVFDETDWLAVARKRPDAPGVGKARGLEDTVADRQTRAAGETTKRQARLQRAVDKAQKARDEAAETLKKARKAAGRKAADVGKDTKRSHPGLAKAKAAKARADDKLKASKAELKRLEKLRGPKESSGLSALLTTMTAGGIGTLGLLAGGPAAGAAALLAGTRLGSAMTRPGVQRAVAGQLPVQEATAAALRNPAMQAIPAGVRRTAGGLPGNYDEIEEE